MTSFKNEIEAMNAECIEMKEGGREGTEKHREGDDHHKLPTKLTLVTLNTVLGTQRFDKIATSATSSRPSRGNEVVS